MGRLGLDRVLDCFSLSISSSSCLCINPLGDEDGEYGVERDSLIKSQGDQILRLRDVLEPKVILLFFFPRIIIYVHYIMSLSNFYHFFSPSLFFFLILADCNLEGLYALQWLRKESREAHQENGWYE